jgi:hypothetical protein
VLPAIVIVPLRGDSVVLGSTEYPRAPLPVPGDPPVAEIQLTLLSADHAQDEVTLTLPVALPAPTLTVAGEMVAVPHDDVSMKVFDTVLCADPPGPFAETRAS